MKILNFLNIGLFLASFNAFSNPNANFEKSFDILASQHLPNTAIGLIIQDPKTGAVLFERHAQENYYPASNTKLFTAAAALKFFGPNFQYQTSVTALIDKVKDGVLSDNLYFVFRGDPSFSSSDLAALVKQIKVKGINKIN
ncbi:MAG: D-alanyl-D-alanine carboxypeptidase, partial [Candidatus Berkiella sp.]